MAEYPYQTYARLVGRNWPGAAELATLYRQLGITAPVGSATGNVALQKALLGGWRPGQVAAAPPPAPPPAPAPAPAPAAAPTPPSGLGVPVQPGITAEQWAASFGLQERIAAYQEATARAAEARAARAQEAQLAANPADFVAYELYKRALQAGGQTPTTGAARSDTEIQNLFSTILNLPQGGLSLGTGQFGVELPSTGSISREQLGQYSPSDLGILSSFLRGGVETQPGKLAGVDPEGYFRDLERGLVPVLQLGRTQYSF